MSKLNASLSKKLPIPGQAYSCRQYGASVEVELPEEATAEDIRDRLRKTYALLEAAVDEEFARANEAAPQARTQDGDAAFSGRRASPHFVSSGAGDEDGEASRWSQRENRDDGYDNGGRDNNGRGNNGFARRGWGRQGERRDGRGGGFQKGQGLASQAQVKAIFGIAKANGIDRRDLLERVQKQYQRTRVEDLTVRQASEIIAALKQADCA